MENRPGVGERGPEKIRRSYHCSHSVDGDAEVKYLTSGHPVSECKTGFEPQSLLRERTETKMS